MFERLSIEVFSERVFFTASVEIWVEDGKLHYEKDVLGHIVLLPTRDPDGTIYIPGGDPKGISEVPVEEFSKKMERLHIEDWTKKYELISHEYLDGESWELIYETAENGEIKVSGCNAYPKEWNRLISLLRSTVGDTGVLKMKNKKMITEK